MCNPRFLLSNYACIVVACRVSQQNGRLPAGVGQVTYSCSDGSDESTCENTCDQISLMDSLCYCGSACTNVTRVGLLCAAHQHQACASRGCAVRLLPSINNR